MKRMKPRDTKANRQALLDAILLKRSADEKLAAALTQLPPAYVTLVKYISSRDHRMERLFNGEAGLTPDEKKAEAKLMLMLAKEKKS